MASAVLAILTRAYGLFNTLYALSVAGMPVCRSANGSSKYAAGPLPGCAQNQTPFHDFLSVYRAVGYAVDVCGRRALCALCRKPQCFFGGVCHVPGDFFCLCQLLLPGLLRKACAICIPPLGHRFPKLWQSWPAVCCFLLLLFEWAWRKYERAGTVFGEPVGTQAQAQLAVLPLWRRGSDPWYCSQHGGRIAFFMDIQQVQRGRHFPADVGSMRRQPGGAGRF